MRPIFLFQNQNQNGPGWSEAGLGLGEARLAQAQPGSGLVYSKFSFGPAGLSRRSDSGSEKRISFLGEGVRGGGSAGRARRTTHPHGA